MEIQPAATLSVSKVETARMHFDEHFIFPRRRAVDIVDRQDFGTTKDSEAKGAQSSPDMDLPSGLVHTLSPMWVNGPPELFANAKHFS